MNYRWKCRAVKGARILSSPSEINFKSVWNSGFKQKIFREQNDKGTEKEIFSASAHNLPQFWPQVGPLLLEYLGIATKKYASQHGSNSTWSWLACWTAWQWQNHLPRYFSVLLMQSPGPHFGRISLHHCKLAGSWGQVEHNKLHRNSLPHLPIEEERSFSSR